MSHFVRFYFLQHVLCLKEDTGYSLNHCVHWYKFLVWSIKLPPRHCIVYFGSNYIIVVAPFIVSHRNFLCIKFADNRYQGTHEWFLKKNYLLGGLEQANQHYDKFIPKCQETTFTAEFLALEQKSCYCQQRKMEVFWSETAKHCRGPMFYVCCKYLHIMSSIKILVQSLILSFFHPIDPLVDIAYTPLVHILRLLL